MKKVFINIITFVVVVSIIIVLVLSLGEKKGPKYFSKNNTTGQAIEIHPKEYQCSDCNMDVEDLNYAAEIITNNGNTYFFDDIGCVVLWSQKHKQEIAKMFTQTLDTHKWIEVKKAWYSRISPSPMGYGFAAIENKKEGLILYDEMETLMLQGKNLHDPFVKKKLLGK